MQLAPIIVASFTANKNKQAKQQFVVRCSIAGGAADMAHITAAECL